MIRVGQGCDIHALVPGRRLLLGGVEIAHHSGLLGHSDADVLLHAITDAVLGAAGLGDIGRMFPDTDERHRGADSARLLALAMDEVRARGWRVGNVDATVARSIRSFWCFEGPHHRMRGDYWPCPIRRRRIVDRCASCWR